jgi:hypothetical protein
MSTDPNWLLSTTARSSAALVGIIGGLPVSRMVSQAGEQAGLARRRRGLGDRVAARAREVDELDRAAREDAELQFILDKEDEAFDARGNVEAAALAAGWGESFKALVTRAIEREVERLERDDERRRR